jgi:site-specific recombinase XerD
MGAWAIIDTLRHNGIRIEEMLELTQLSLRQYTSESTGTLVPLLHIAPSKNDIERLVPMKPGTGHGPAASAAPHQGRPGAGATVGPLRPARESPRRTFPHRFARRIGTRQAVIAPSVVRRLLNDVAASAGLQDAGEAITFTPHDFRPLFTTEVVSSGLPLHIAATLLGHLNLGTTRGYTAVFPDEVVAAHQHLTERPHPAPVR